MIILNNEKQAFCLAFVLVILLPLTFGCSKNAGDNSQTSNDKSDSAKSTTSRKGDYQSDEGWPFVAGYSPLTYEKYSDLRDDTDSFSLIEIAYRNDSNYDQGIARDYIWVGISGGFAGKNFIFSSMDNYHGTLYKDIDGVSPPNGESFYSSFTSAQVEPIYTYLESNSAYFFNGLEYTGFTPPVDSEGEYLIDADNMFYLSFAEPGDLYYAWAIHKCMDDPDPILQGLIDIINVEFISQFE